MMKWAREQTLVSRRSWEEKQMRVCEEEKREGKRKEDGNEEDES